MHRFRLSEENVLEVVLLITVVVIAILIATTCHASASTMNARVPTSVYQLDSGEFVRWWIEEDTGMLCHTFYHDNLTKATTIECDSLLDTAYNTPAQE